jgi:hypothetical protein
MRVLIIWEEIPENTKFFVIEDATEAQVAMLKRANGQIINYEGPTDGAEWVGRAISKPGEWGVDSQPQDAIWHDKLVESAKLPESGPFDVVIWTGFGM